MILVEGGVVEPSAGVGFEAIRDASGRGLGFEDQVDVGGSD